MTNKRKENTYKTLTEQLKIDEKNAKKLIRKSYGLFKIFPPLAIEELAGECLEKKLFYNKALQHIQCYYEERKKELRGGFIEERDYLAKQANGDEME